MTNEPLVTIGVRERAVVSIFGSLYEYRRPDEGTIIERNKMREAGTTLNRYEGRPLGELNDSQQTRVVEAGREVVRCILPGLPEDLLKMLRINEIAELCGKWSEVYGEARE